MWVLYKVLSRGIDPISLEPTTSLTWPWEVEKAAVRLRSS